MPVAHDTLTSIDLDVISFEGNIYTLALLGLGLAGLGLTRRRKA